MDATLRAAIFKKAAASREAQAPTIEKIYGGLPFRVRRVNLQGWAASGRLPNALTTKLLKLLEKGKQEGTTADFTTDEIAMLLEFQKQIVFAAVVEPKIVDEKQLDREPTEDEVGYGFLIEHFNDAILELMADQIAGCPEAPVQTREGEIPYSAVESFRHEPEGQESAGTGALEQDVGRAAE